ncbi:MAG: sigma 54-interacting transcriptional regulator [Deltaproteobacteria bacterium]|nr:sigma 54-interacting transcriptional regulator [Deltaproteobacteria bacterium]
MNDAADKSSSTANIRSSVHSYEELAALHAVARILSQPLELRGQFEQVLQIMSSRLGMQRGMISLLNQDKKEAWLDVAHGVDLTGKDVTYKRGEGITGKVVETGRPMAVADLGQDAHFLDRTGARRDINRSTLAFICVPIIYDNRIVGVLSADKAAANVENLDMELAVLSSLAELTAKTVHIRAIEEENRRLKRIVDSTHTPVINIVGHSQAMQEVFSLVSHVADSNTTVLITGETGTGKELIAKAIHMNSSRRRSQLVQVNCAAIPDNLIESELFGHERGAFTGALYRRRGRFEEAGTGTIFLDEVGELSLTAQAKLLRVLQERQLQPVGSSRVVKVNARIITATNRNLEQDISTERFRTDLYYRLNVFSICLPPLRERGADIISLTDYFIAKYCKEAGKNVKKISPAVIEVFLNHKWPGNVRELENCIERAVLICNGDVIERMHLPPSLQAQEKTHEIRASNKLSIAVEAQEKALIMDALERAGGNQTKTARILGTTKRIIQYKIKKLDIDTKPFRGKT